MLLASIPVVADFFKSHAWVSLAVIGGTLLCSVIASVVIEVEAEAEESTEVSDEEAV
jgi:hypothetical protein